MSMDWKEMLNNLKESGNVPKAPEDSEPIEKEENQTKVQKSPVTVIIDKKGRNGKTATIIEGLTGNEDVIKKLARDIKQKLGKGGSVREGEILIQGECKKEVTLFLQNSGYKVK